MKAPRKKPGSGHSLFYSTTHGKMCAHCGEPVIRCACRKSSLRSSVRADGIVRLYRQRKGRRGKGVTLVTGVALGPAELAGLAKELKRRCGSGGTVKNGVIEIQGDHRDLLLKLLSEHGWVVKCAGG